jgi:hypothetical protein
MAMGEKTRVPSISDTFELDGIYYTDEHLDLNTPELEAKRALYEQINPHVKRGRHIDEEV